MSIIESFQKLKYKPTPLNLFAAFLLLLGVYFLCYPGYYLGRIIFIPLSILAALLFWADTYSQRKIKKYSKLLLLEIAIVAIVLTIWYWLISH
jgi:drug/metabolite transporter (DMT)-like permease